jgi:hypothetical protein
LFFYKLEEFRPLSHHELKFRVIIKGQIQNLLAMQNTYWRQRFTQRLVQFGDESTKFFHAMASKRYKKNVISQIVDNSGRMISDHTVKSTLFYQEWDALSLSICSSNFIILYPAVAIWIISVCLLATRKLIILFWTCPLTKP